MRTSLLARFTPQVVAGLCLMALGILVGLDRLGAVPIGRGLQFWPVALILFGASIIVQAVVGGTDEAGARRRPRVPIGLIVLLVIVGVVASRDGLRPNPTSDSANRVTLSAVLGGARHVSTARVFEGAELTSVMGGTDLDLREAQMAPGSSATIDVFALMGGGTIRVPLTWRVEFQVTPVLGGVDDNRWSNGDRGPRRRRPRPDWMDDSGGPPPGPGSAEAETAAQTGEPGPLALAPDAPRLIVRGTVIMGGIQVRS